MKRVHTFRVTSPGMMGLGISAMLIVPTCILGIGALHAFTNSSPALFVLMTLPILLIVVLGWLCFRRNHVQLDAETLTITAGPHRLKVPRKSLDADKARVINMDTQTDVQIGIKTFGTSFPGYAAGYFSRRGGGKIFALLTDKTRVLALPEHDGRLLLLSLENPHALLKALARN